MKNVLVNDISYSNHAVRNAIISKIKYWGKHNYSFAIFTSKAGVSFYRKHLQNVSFIVLPYAEECPNKFLWIFEYLKRNSVALFFVNNLINKYDIVYSISSVLDLAIFPYVFKIFDKKIKWVVLFENVVPLNDPGNKLIRFLSWVFFHISLFTFRKADLLLPISDSLKEYLISKEFKKNRLIVSGNGIEVDLIRRAKKDNKFNIDALFIGRINETKGIYDLLKVLQIVRKKYPNFQLAIMGRGDKTTEKQFKNEIIKNNLGKNVQLLGYKSDLEKFSIIKSSKIFLFLSVSESFGISLLEAVCCGLKAVVYELEPYKKIYLNNEVIMVTKNDYKSAAKKVMKLFDKRDFSNKNGELLLEQYSWDKIAKIELNVFRNI
ncbi:MAG: glycosyltransferase [bacterium]|nr:glycosyltransferase [bacterium]